MNGRSSDLAAENRGTVIPDRPARLADDRQMGQKLTDLACAELQRMALAVEEDKPSDPVHVRLLRPIGVVQCLDDVAHPVQQTHGSA